MPTLPILTLAVALLSPSQVVDDSGEMIRIQFDEIDGTELTDFLKLMEIQLGRPLAYEPSDVEDVRLLIIGAIEIDRGDFLAYAETLLFSRGLLLVEYGPMLAVVSRSSGISGAHKPGFIKALAPFVPRDELMATWQDRRQVVTTTVALRATETTEVVSMLQTYFTDPMVESVRAIEGAVIMTGTAESLRQAVTLIDALEKNAAAAATREASRLEARVKELEQKVADLAEALADRD